MKHFFSLLRGWPVALLILLWLAGPAARAQAPAWQSALAVQNASSPSSYSYVRSIATDASGNVYLVGEFFGNVTFGTTVLTASTSTTNGLDGFVAKWNAGSGSFAWAVRLGGSGQDVASAVAVSGSSVYVAGYFSSATAAFGSISLPNATGSGAVSDGFVTKLTDAGSSAAFAWASPLGGLQADQATAVAVRGSSVYVAGLFASPSLTVGSTALTNAGTATNDGFVARFTDAGTSASATWATGLGGPGTDQVSGLALSSTGVLVTGNFSSAAQFGLIALTSAGDVDVFVAKLTEMGTAVAVAWAVRAGGTSGDVGDAVAASGTSVFVTGGFASPTVAFGSAALTLTPASATGNNDVFVAKLTDVGTSAAFVWAQQSVSTGNDRTRAVAVSGANVYVAGSFGPATAAFGSTILTNVSTATASDIFVAKLVDAGTSGSFAWARQAGGLSGESAYALALNGTSVLVAGGASPSAAFGTTVVNAASSTAGFLASLTDPTLLATSTARGTLPFILSPNPARATATVQLPAGLGAATAALTLRDALGRTLRTSTVALPAAGLRHALDLSGLAPGVYAVQVRAGSTSGTQRLVVE